MVILCESMRLSLSRFLGSSREYSVYLVLEYLVYFLESVAAELNSLLCLCWHVDGRGPRR